MDSKQEIPERKWPEGYEAQCEEIHARLLREKKMEEMFKSLANRIITLQSQLTSAREQIEALNGQLLDKQKLYTDAILRGDALEALQLELDMQNATLSMAVARLGGIVEGNPTGKHNFLQRIDELIAQEGRYRYWLWANHGHSGPALYGDDGEMQCKYCPIVDYKRADLGEIEDQATVARGVMLSQRWAIDAEKEAKIRALEAQLAAVTGKVTNE